MNNTNPIKGMTLMGASNVAFCGMACLIRYASDVNAYTTTLFRFIIGLGIMCSLAMTGRIRLSFVDKKGLALRGLIGSVSVLISFISIPKLGLIWSSIIMNTYPVFAFVFGAILLKERITALGFVSLAGATAGMVILFVHGQSHCTCSGAMTYKIIAVAGSVLAGLTVVLIKKLQETDSTASIFFAQCLVGLWVTVVPAGSVSLHCGFAGCALLIMIGVLATLGQLSMTEGYRHVSVSSGSVFVLSAPVINFGAGILLFHEPFSIWSLAGSAIVLFSSGLILFEDKIRLG
jgi:drug/metabolite transporter (DMT)-like permease